MSIILRYRGVIGLDGPDSKTFLQGLVTNDVHKVREDKFLFALMLSAQGKLLYDFFITQKGELLLLDCPQNYIEDIIQKFKLYRLRANVNIVNMSKDLNVVVESERQVDSKSFFLDSRNPELGYRALLTNDELNLLPNMSLKESQEELQLYSQKRITLKVPEVEYDFKPQEFFPLHLGLDKLNAIDYDKGCYIGQEVVARATYGGVLRKKIYKATFENKAPPHATEVTADKQKIGVVLGSCDSLALCLLDIDQVEESLKSAKKIGTCDNVILSLL